jgi:cell division protein FtsB
LKLPLPPKMVWLAGGLLLVAAVSLGWLMVGEKGLLELRRLKAESAEMERGNAGLRRVNQGLSARAAQLKNDPEAIERLARERLGMVKEGEVVYYLPQQRPQAGQGAPPQAAR